MKQTILFVLFWVGGFMGFAQNPLVKQWDKRFGGTEWDLQNSICKAKDGGYLIGGASLSGITGDKTQPNWDATLNTPDFWVVKVDWSGNKQWDKRFGGTVNDDISSVQQTRDGGYILAGESLSGISGDKTQTSRGSIDYWVVKIDSIGNKIWDKRFGGNGFDGLTVVKQTSDGGYILGGWTQSGANGDRTQPLQGAQDYWIVKIDSAGNKLWDKRFGGTGAQQAYSLEQTADGGYIVGGVSNSGIGGDKTQPSRGGYDYWIVKIDSVGIKQWDKTFGGAGLDGNCGVKQTHDNGYIVYGGSLSGVSGDRTVANWDATLATGDYWIVKTDSLGNKLWDKRYGGTANDAANNIGFTTDGGFFITGYAASNAGGDKSENNLGVGQVWVLKTDSLGNKQWDKTILTNGTNSEVASLAPIDDGCYVMSMGTDAGIAGDKTQTSRGKIDYWIIKFCDTTNCNNLVSLGVSGNILTAYNAVTYQWFLNGNYIIGADSATYTATQTGNYTVQVTYSNGCGAVSNPVHVVVSGISSLAIPNSEFRIYPNPATSQLFIETNGEEIKQVNIYNTLGEMVMAVPLNTKYSILNTAFLPTGVYIAEVKTTPKSPSCVRDETKGDFEIHTVKKRWVKE